MSSITLINTASQEYKLTDFEVIPTESDIKEGDTLLIEVGVQETAPPQPLLELREVASAEAGRGGLTFRDVSGNRFGFHMVRGRLKA